LELLSFKSYNITVSYSNFCTGRPSVIEEKGQFLNYASIKDGYGYTFSGSNLWPKHALGKRVNNLNAL